MKKIYLFKMFLMAFVLMLLGGVNASAEEVAYKTLTFNSSVGSGVSSYAKTWTATIANDNWSIVNFNNNNWKDWNYIRCGSKSGASVASITTSFSIDKPISSVVVTIDAVTAANVNSTKLYVSTTADFSNIIETVSLSIAKGDLSFKIKSPQENCYYKLEIDCKQVSNGFVQISKVVYNYETSSTSTPTKTLIDLYPEGTAEDIYVGDAFTHNGIKIIAKWDDNTTTDVTDACQYTGYNMSEIGTQVITATYKKQSVTYNVNVKTIANTAETAYTPTKAIELINAGKGLNVPVYVKGKVSSIASAWTSTYGNISFFVSEDGTEDKFEFFRNYKGADNEKYASAEETPNIGDEVVGYGKLTKYDKTYEFDSGNYIVSIERGKVLQYDESSCSVMLDAADNVFPTLTNTYGTSVTYESSDKNVATIDAEGNVTLVGLGTTTITATLDADNSVTASYTLNVARAKVWDLSVNHTTTATADKIEWVDNVVTMTGDKGTATTNANSYVGGVNSRTSTRFYTNSTYSITPADGITILKIEYFATTTDYATALKNSTWTNATASLDGQTVTIVPTDGTQMVSAKIGDTTGATKVIVYYLGEPTVENKPLVATDSEGAYYATFSSDRDVVFTSDVIVYAVNIKDGKLDMTALSTGNYTTTNSTTSTVTNGFYVPANTGVLIEALDAEMTYYTAAAKQTFASLPTNQLVAVTTDGVFTGDADHKYYKLAYDDYEAKTGLGFYYGAADGAPFTVKKGLAYLAVPVVNGGSLAAGYAFGGNGDDDTTGINGIENDNVNETQTIYNLQGQRVEKAGLRGIYIVNGKKVVLK